MNGWQKVFRSSNQARAELVKGVLTAHGFTAMVLNRKESLYQLFGYFDVLVPAEEVLRAIRIIEDEITFTENE